MYNVIIFVKVSYITNILSIIITITVMIIIKYFGIDRVAFWDESLSRLLFYPCTHSPTT